jgi:tetratricopeptide (TPR) repeat protein
VPVPVALPLGKDWLRLQQLAQQIDPASEPVLGLLTLTRALRLTGADAVAERLLRTALQARPREVVLYYTLGQLLQEQQPPRWAKAAECYLATRALRPDLGVKLAQALRHSGREREGLDLLARLIKDSPNNPYLYFEQAGALFDKHDLNAAIACYQKVLELNPTFAEAHNNLGSALFGRNDFDGAIDCYQKALKLAPKYADGHYNIGLALYAKHDLDGAIAYYRKALDLDPRGADIHAALGLALYHKHDLDAAIASCRKAIALDAKSAHTHNTLGLALHAKGDVDAAIACYHKALDLDPKYVVAHNNLGNALAAKGDLDGALACFHTALDLNPQEANTYYNFGVALYDKQDLDGALAHFHKAIDLNPKLALAHYNLGIVLRAKGDLDGAIASYHKALDLNPAHVGSHHNLGNALNAKGRLDEAIAEYRQAAALDPNLPQPHYSLGNALRDKGRPDEARDAYRRAIRQKPDYAEAHCNLGLLLQEQGRFAEALADLRRGHELGSKQPGWRYPSAQWVREAEHLLTLNSKLTVVLSGQQSPTNPDEAIALASLCRRQCKKWYVASARFYADAFAAAPKLAADLNQQHRYNAAGTAALAAANQDKDTHQLPDKVVTMFRRWALGWLRDDLTAYAKLAEKNNPAVKQTIQQRLAHWHNDPDLASFRDRPGLERLPEGERAAWQALWRDVDELAKRVTKKVN